MRTLPGPPFRNRSGLSIVEVLVALMLVTVGMMGIAGSTALSLRTTLDSARRREAAARATSRISQLASAGCARVTAGTSVDSTRQLNEQWWVVAHANGFTTITDSVDWSSARGRKSFALTSAITC